MKKTSIFLATLMVSTLAYGAPSPTASAPSTSDDLDQIFVQESAQVNKPVMSDADEENEISRLEAELEPSARTVVKKSASKQTATKQTASKKTQSSSIIQQ